LIDYFGTKRTLRSITPGDADPCRLDQTKPDKADNTILRSCGIASRFFNVAVHRYPIEFNPFADLVGAFRANPSRCVFVRREATDRMLTASPDSEWRLLLALARYGGFRVPSEVLRLMWSDIDWDNNPARQPHATADIGE